MRQWSVAGWTGILAVIVSSIVLALMLYRAAGMPDGGGGLSLDPLGWALLIAALACLTLSAILTIYGHFLKSALQAETAAQEESRPTPSDESVPGEVGKTVDVVNLTEDERRLYELIVAAGGEILQMNLVSSGEFSKSKVTRLLDKLERRGLIKRERRGMTNLVHLSGDE